MVLGYLRGEREPIFNQSKKLFFLQFFKVALGKKKKKENQITSKGKNSYSTKWFRVRIIEKEQMKRMRQLTVREK